jgi:hypothetical protein
MERIERPGWEPGLANRHQYSTLDSKSAVMCDTCAVKIYETLHDYFGQMMNAQQD